MIGRFAIAMCVAALSAPGTTHAQDVPGIEICTAEKTMERRTSCLQSNIEFLQKTIAKLVLDNQQKLDSANRQVDALKASVAALQRSFDELKAAQGRLPESAKKPDASSTKETMPKDAVKDASKESSK